LWTDRKSVREDPSAMPDVMNAPSSAGGKADGEPRINAAEGNGYSKRNRNAGQKKANAHGRSVADPADINIVDGKNFGTKVTFTVSSAAESSYPRRSGRRKQDAAGDIDLSSDNKRQRTHDLPADFDMGCKQIFDDNVINDVRQSDPPHVSGKFNIQEKDGTTDTSDLDDINTEAADTIHEKKKTACYSESISFPDPDFFNFEKLRDVSLFSVGQIWA
jgi:hypothetical protein